MKKFFNFFLIVILRDFNISAVLWIFIFQASCVALLSLVRHK